MPGGETLGRLRQGGLGVALTVCIPLQSNAIPHGNDGREDLSLAEVAENLSASRS